MFLQSSRTFVARVRARHWLDIDGAHALCEEGVDEKQFSVVVAQILQQRLVQAQRNFDLVFGGDGEVRSGSSG